MHTITKTALWAVTAGFLGNAAMGASADMSSIDANGDGVADYGEFATLFAAMTPAIFAVIDRDANGVVTQDELYRGSAQEILMGFGAKPVSRDVLIDLDANGSASYREVELVIPGFRRDRFHALDLNGDGRLDMIEFNATEAQAWVTSAESKVIYLLKSEIDLDGNGRLSDDELSRAIPGYRPGGLEPIQSVRPSRRGVLRAVGRVIR